MRRCARTIFFVLPSILLISSVCSANTGLPIILTSRPFMLLGLAAVVLIEALVFTVGLRALYRKALLAVGVANLVSIILGYPLLLITGSNVVSMPFDWALDFHQFGAVIFWLWILMTLSILTIAFLISVYLEYFIIRGFFRNEDRRRLRDLSFRANLITYALLLAVLLTLTHRMW
jgi:hypothetical protein